MDRAFSYDEVAYPATIFHHTHPERLFAMAFLHGLKPRPIATARVLEIGGGVGMNVINMAVAYPEASFYSFDLSSVAVARGQAAIAACGLANVRVEVGDILDLADTMDGSYDYVICHGVYAWVPEAVRAAIMKLIGRVLSDDGVAFVSYNAKPGGHLRIAIREMLLRHVEGMDDPETRIRAGQAFLTAYGEKRDGDTDVQTAMRGLCRSMNAKRGAVLYHDELGEVFAPQALIEVARAAGAHGLQYLNDAGQGMLNDGFIEDDDEDSAEAVLIAAQRRDDYNMRFFRNSLFVRAGRTPTWRLDPERIKDLSVSSRAVKIGDSTFAAKGAEFDITDPALAQVIERLSAAWPLRVPLRAVSRDDDIARTLFLQFDEELVELHGAPLPCATDMPKVPRLSPLVRYQVATGEDEICALDHVRRRIEEPGPRAFISMVDGKRTAAELQLAWSQTEYAAETPFATAMILALKAGLVMKDE